MLGRQFKKAGYALLAARYGGIGYVFNSAKQRTYRKETFLGLAKDLNEPDIKIQSRVEYSLKRASREDINEMLDGLRTEGRESIFELIQRKWFYESGYQNCYVARTKEENELCYLQWAITLQDANAYSTDFKLSFPRLGENDMQLEHAYTFIRFRGNKIMPAVMNDLFNVARSKGLKRVTTYVLSDNTASLKGCYNVGFKTFEVVRRTQSPFATHYEITPTVINE
jgi:RimJ/RimL family protein N-acetyltransferase